MPKSHYYKSSQKSYRSRSAYRLYF